MKKPSGPHVAAASREAPGPWRIGERDGGGIRILDANGDLVATVSTAPPRSAEALEGIQAVLVGAGRGFPEQRHCANPACGRPFDAPSPRQRHCSSTCGVATQPHVIEARARDGQAYELRWAERLTWRAIAERCGLSSPQRARLGALKHARRSGLPVPP